MRPESADALYGRIETAANTATSDALKACTPRHDNISRRGIPTIRGPNKCARWKTRSQQSSPIQRAYADARRASR